MPTNLVPTLDRVEILLWLVPPLVVTVVTMLWVSWIGRQGRGEVDRDEAVRRLGVALEKEHVVPPGRPPRRTREPATGVAVRRSTERAPGKDLEDDVPEEERCAS